MEGMTNEQKTNMLDLAVAEAMKAHSQFKLDGLNIFNHEGNDESIEEAEEKLDDLIDKFERLRNLLERFSDEGEDDDD
jgi:hypothetical protein